MEFFVLLIIVGIIFVFFIMKGSGGNSFYKHRKEIHKTVEQNGGMYKFYEKFVDYFKEEGFQIREVNKDSVYLHYGTDIGKVGIQIVQVDPREAEIVMGVELRNGNSHDTGIKVNVNEDQMAMVDRLIEKFSDGELSDFKNIGINFNKHSKQQQQKSSINDTPKNEPKKTNKINLVREYWENSIENPEMPEASKKIISEFFIPDSINPKIYEANNSKIINGTIFAKVSDDEPLVSNKLREYSKANGMIPMGIPTWFTAAYPDVLFWFAREGGISELEKHVDMTKKENFIVNDQIKPEYLRKFIDIYKQNVKPSLETAKP